jgi:DNA mismatch endonuclease (patch repair protein)
VTEQEAGVSVASATIERIAAPIPSSVSVQLRMQRQPSRDTPMELAFRRILHRRGLRYRVHRRPLPGVARTADVVFSSARVAVYVDGCFWHGCPDHYMQPRSNSSYWLPKIEGNRRRDADTDARLVAAGWVPFRLWEHEDLEAAAERLACLLAARRRGVRA